mmetsp:Transcript_23274/g.57784  ORF Transcript_23274/g.57784 Transcript_23274/m.57784 type:complete len:274 (+) Transcript_23274:244-1065(+)
MPLRRPQILPKRHHLHARAQQIPHRLPHLRVRLPQPQHHARLRHQPRHHLLRARQHRQALRVPRAAVADRGLQALHGLDVVREDVEAGRRDEVDAGEVAGKVRGQRLDHELGLRALDLTDSVGEVLRAAVRDVVAVNRSEDHVFKSPLCDGFGDVARLVGVERRRGVGGFDAAEAAAAGAGVAHEHEGGGAAAPALADVGAPRLLADGGETQAARVGAEPGVLGGELVVARRAHVEPLGFLWVFVGVGPSRDNRLGLLLTTEVHSHHRHRSGV